MTKVRSTESNILSDYKFHLFILKHVFENNRGFSECQTLGECCDGLAMQSVVSSSGNSFTFQPNVPEGYAASLEIMTKQRPSKPKGCQITVATFFFLNNYEFRGSCKAYTGKTVYLISSLPLWLCFRQLYVTTVQQCFI